MISVLNYTVVCWKKGALVGINGTAAAAFSAGFVILMGVIYGINIVFMWFDDEFMFIKDGMVTKHCVLIAAMALMLLYGIVYAVLARKTKKQLDENNNEEE